MPRLTRIVSGGAAVVLGLLLSSAPASAVSTIAWGDAGGGQGEFVFQVFPGIAADRSGNVWVTDQGNNRVEEFTGEGTFIRALGCAPDASTPCSSSSANGQFSYPSGIAADLTRNEVYVSDRFNDRVEVFSTSTGAFLRSWNLTNPIGIAVDRSGNVYVDTSSGIIRSDRNGTGRSVLASSPTPGDVADQLATSDKGDLFTVFFDQQTATRDIVQKLTSLGVSAASSPPTPSVVFFGPSFSPGGPTAGQVTVANYGYPGGGDALYTFGSSLRSPSSTSPSANGQPLSRPEATAYDCAGNLYVLDGDNGRIVKLVYGAGSAICPGVGGVNPISKEAIGSLVAATTTTATARVSCPLRICAGTIQLVSAGQALGATRFTVPGDSTRLLTVKLDARGRLLLRAGRPAPLTIVTSSRGKIVRRFTTLKAPTAVGAVCPASVPVGTPVRVDGLVHRASGGGVPSESVAFVYGQPHFPYTRGTVRTGRNGTYQALFTPDAPGRWTVHVDSLGDRKDAPADARPCSFTVTTPAAITLGPGFHPTDVVDATGTLHAVWAFQKQDGTDALEYCEVPQGALVCQNETQLPALPGSLSAPFLLQRADGSLVVIDSRSDGHTYAIVSPDGGKTWQTPAVVGGGFGENDVRLTPDGQSADRIYGATGSNSFQRTPLTGGPETSSINLDAGPGGDPGDWYFGQIAYLANGNPLVVFGDLTDLAYRVYGGGSLYDQSSWTPFPPSVIGEGSNASLASGPAGVYLLSESTGAGAARVELRVFTGATTGFGPPAGFSPTDETSVNTPMLVEDSGGGLTAGWVSNGSLVYRHADPGTPFGPAQTVYSAPVTGNVYDLRLGASASGSRWAVWDDNSSTGDAHALRLP